MYSWSVTNINNGTVCTTEKISSATFYYVFPYPGIYEVIALGWNSESLLFNVSTITIISG